MNNDRFDRMIVEIEARSFEVGMLMTSFVQEILENFREMRTDIFCEIPFYDPSSGYKMLTTDSVYIDIENGSILVAVAGFSAPLSWEELNISAKEIIITELHHIYKAVEIYNELSSKEEVH